MSDVANGNTLISREFYCVRKLISDTMYMTLKINYLRLNFR